MRDHPLGPVHQHTRGQLQLLDLVLLDHAADAEDPHVFQGGVGADAMADLLAVDVRQHDVEDDQVGPVLLDHHAGVEAGGGHADLESAVLLEHLGHQLDELGVVVHEQDLALAALQRIGRDAVVLHELVERLAGDPAEAGAGHAEALQLAVVETADDGLLADLADLGGFAGRENGLHGFVHPLLALGQSHECGPRHASP